jgi:hypothetical protein
MFSARFHAEPNTQYSMIGDELWLSIGNPLSTTSPPPRRPSVNENLSTSVSTIPDEGLTWYNRDTHWKAWTPIASSESWFGMDGSTMCDVGDGGLHTLAARFLQVINKDVKDAAIRCRRFTYDATLAELTSLEETMRSMMDDGQIHPDVIAKLWQVDSTRACILQ